MGYYQAGFDVIGVDKFPQPNYPFTFIQHDVRTLKLEEYMLDISDFSAIHASPPCQIHSTITATAGTRHNHEDHIPYTRSKLIRSGLPYVIENVPGAPLINPIQLCGSSFGLRLRRHRLFESSIDLVGKECWHKWQDDEKIFSPMSYRRGDVKANKSGVIGVFGGGQGLGNGEVWMWKMAMGILWMRKAEMAQAIPPCYTRYIGRQLLNHINNQDDIIYDEDDEILEEDIQ